MTILRFFTALWHSPAELLPRRSLFPPEHPSFPFANLHFSGENLTRMQELHHGSRSHSILPLALCSRTFFFYVFFLICLLRRREASHIPVVHPCGAGRCRASSPERLFAGLSPFPTDNRLESTRGLLLLIFRLADLFHGSQLQSPPGTAVHVQGAPFSFRMQCFLNYLEKSSF